MVLQKVIKRLANSVEMKLFHGKLVGVASFSSFFLFLMGD
jgi:hypothetical protein